VNISIGTEIERGLPKLKRNQPSIVVPAVFKEGGRDGGSREREMELPKLEKQAQRSRPCSV